MTTQEKLDKALDLLQSLADLQNGPPLEKCRDEYEEVMTQVWKFLESEKPITIHELKTLMRTDWIEKWQKENPRTPLCGTTSTCRNLILGKGEWYTFSTNILNEEE